MAMNKLLYSVFEDAHDKKSMTFTSKQINEFDYNLEELNIYLDMLKVIRESISQNEVNVAHLLNTEIKDKYIRDQDGNPIGVINTELTPTMTNGDNLGMLVVKEIHDQEEKIFDNPSGLLKHTNPDEFKESLGYTQKDISVESIRISPISTLRYHTESLKSILSKLIEMIKNGINWIIERSKDFGHGVLMLVEDMMNKREKLLKYFKDHQEANKKLKPKATLSDSTILTLVVDMVENLNTAKNIYTNVLAPYTKAYTNLFKGWRSHQFNPSKLDFIIHNSNKDLKKYKLQSGDHFLNTLGFKKSRDGKAIDNFIMLSRPNQILSLDVGHDGLWSVVKTDIELNPENKNKLLAQANIDELWEMCIEYLNKIPLIKKMALELRKDIFSLRPQDTWAADIITDLTTSSKGEYVYRGIKFLNQIIGFRKSILKAFYILPRSIYSACVDLYKNTEITQTGDYSKPTLPKPTQEFFGFKRSSRYSLFSNIDFEKSYKGFISEMYSDAESLKKDFSLYDVLESDSFETMTKLNEGFSLELDTPDDVTQAIENIERDIDISNYIKFLKSSVKLSNFTKVIDISKSDYDTYYAISKGKESIKYHRDSFLESLKSNLKEAQVNKDYEEFVEPLKKLISVTEKHLKLSEEFLDLFGEHYRVDKGDEKLLPITESLVKSFVKKRVSVKGFGSCDISCLNNLVHVQEFFGPFKKSSTDVAKNTINDIGLAINAKMYSKDELDKLLKLDRSLVKFIKTNYPDVVRYNEQYSRDPDDFDKDGSIYKKAEAKLINEFKNIIKKDITPLEKPLYDMFKELGIPTDHLDKMKKELDIISYFRATVFNNTISVVGVYIDNMEYGFKDVDIDIPHKDIPDNVKEKYINLSKEAVINKTKVTTLMPGVASIDSGDLIKLEYDDSLMEYIYGAYFDIVDGQCSIHALNEDIQIINGD